MIKPKTILKIADNSGAKTAKCIQILGGYKKKQGKIGDIVVVSIQKLRDNQKKAIKLKKKDVFKAIIIRTNNYLKLKNGFFLKFNSNSIALLDKQKNPFATRILGFMPKKLKKKCIKLVSICSIFI